MIAAVLAAALSTAQIRRVDAIVVQVMHDSGISGASLGVARRGAPSYERGYGSRDASGHRADAYTIYAAGSIAKQFTAALVLQDVERGVLSLDAGDPPLRDLLGQTVGGTWEYRNENYAALGTILERADGLPYCRLLDARIAYPLNLQSTSCGPPFGASNVAAGSRPNDRPIAAAAGGLWSNVPDLLRWLEDLRAGRVVAQTSLRAMTRSVRLPDGTPANYGFGFFTADWYGYPVAFADGFVDGYSCVDVLSLDDGLELALLTNADRFDVVPLAKSVFAIVDPPRDRNLYASPSAPPANEDPAITSAIRTALAAPAYAPLGGLRQLEFLERTVRGTLTYDRYRATFTAAVRVVTAGYDRAGAIRTLTVEPP